ncbi:hypothetical protein [Mammaliicoccus sciuri]|nr:hypothetical protein [Mammaliicoccus sciuri]MEB7782255.1 hypothetical protein [Mammaliicoccus sciuri]
MNKLKLIKITLLIIILAEEIRSATKTKNFIKMDLDEHKLKEIVNDYLTS